MNAIEAQVIRDLRKYAAIHARDLERAREPVPVIEVLSDGQELLVGQATTTFGAERLMERLAQRNPGATYQVDVTRTPDEVLAAEEDVA